MKRRSLHVLIVDDSALMRRYLRQILEDGGHEVSLARDGQDALERVAALNPDVVTLDINMPRMDGLTCLSHLMVQSPRPVVMLSSLTERGALATLEALQLGAVDYIAKPGGTVSHNLQDVAAEILRKVEAAGTANARRPPPPLPPPPSSSSSPSSPSSSPAPRTRAEPRPLVRPPATAAAQPCDLVLIGASTGGPSTLTALLSALPARFPAPILVAQHMPAHFTRVFAQRLAESCALQVEEVGHVSPLLPGRILIARGDHDVLVEQRLGRLVAVSVPSDSALAWHPSVDRMVQSALGVLSPRRLIGVLLTGMGNDGAAEMTALHHQGGRTIAESSETAVVYGMPRELIERSGASVTLPAPRIATHLSTWVGALGRPSAATGLSA